MFTVFACSLLLVTCNYNLRLLLVNPTNRLPTTHQQVPLQPSLKTVSANPAKQLQNGFPKCNPLHLDIRYHNYGALRTGLPLANPFLPPHLNIRD